jgi:hypothetical protein
MDEEDIADQYLLVCRADRGYACAFFFAAQRAFIISDNFFLAAGLTGRRTAAFLETAFAGFGADFPFQLAHRCFMAAEIRLRAAGLIVRLFQQPMLPWAVVHVWVQMK